MDIEVIEILESLRQMICESHWEGTNNCVQNKFKVCNVCKDCHQFEFCKLDHNVSLLLKKKK